MLCMECLKLTHDPWITTATLECECYWCTQFRKSRYIVRAWHQNCWCVVEVTTYRIQCWRSDGGATNKEKYLSSGTGSRAGLTIGQIGRLPGASRLNIKTLLGFSCLQAVHHASKLQSFLTLAFIVFEWLKRIEPNSTTLFMTQELDRNQCIHGRPQKFFHGGRVARWPVFHRPGRYFTVNLAEAGKKPVF